MTQSSAVSVLEPSPGTHHRLKWRRRWIPVLVLATLVPYYALLMTAVFFPELLARPLTVGGIPSGWTLALVLLIESWALTGLYVYMTNRAANTSG